MARDYISELVATKNLRGVATENIEVGFELLGKIIFGPKIKWTSASEKQSLSLAALSKAGASAPAVALRATAPCKFLT
jgi:hypothetical protein